jgi:hypothetical protein
MCKIAQCQDFVLGDCEELKSALRERLVLCEHFGLIAAPQRIAVYGRRPNVEILLPEGT